MISTALGIKKKATTQVQRETAGSLRQAATDRKHGFLLIRGLCWLDSHWQLVWICRWPLSSCWVFESTFLLPAGQCLTSVLGVSFVCINNANNFHPKSVSLVSGKLEELRAINTRGKCQAGNISSALEEWCSKCLKHYCSPKNSIRMLLLRPPAINILGRENPLPLTRVVLSDLLSQIKGSQWVLLWILRAWKYMCVHMLCMLTFLSVHRHSESGSSAAWAGFIVQLEPQYELRLVMRMVPFPQPHCQSNEEWGDVS